MGRTAGSEPSGALPTPPSPLPPTIHVGERTRPRRYHLDTTNDQPPSRSTTAERAAFSCVAALAVTAFLAPIVAGAEAVGSDDSRTFPDLPISFAVARLDDRAVVDDEWLDEQVLWANHVFWPHGVAFTVVERRRLPKRFVRLETRQERHDLGVEAKARVINCFVVASLRDVDDPSRMRRGVHWRPQGFPGKHFVVLSAIAGPTVLAHELGHFFGNRRHSDVPGNIMSYTRGDDPPFFDRDQASTVRRTVERFLRSGELVPARSVGESSSPRVRGARGAQSP